MQSAWQAIESMHSIWRDAILLVALAPLAYYVIATIAAFRFLSRTRKNAAQSNASQKKFTPPVSLLKPVHGVDFGSVENFESFCRKRRFRSRGPVDTRHRCKISGAQHSPDLRCSTNWRK